MWCEPVIIGVRGARRRRRCRPTACRRRGTGDRCGRRRRDGSVSPAKGARTAAPRAGCVMVRWKLRCHDAYSLGWQARHRVGADVAAIGDGRGQGAARGGGGGAAGVVTRAPRRRRRRRCRRRARPRARWPPPRARRAPAARRRRRRASCAEEDELHRCLSSYANTAGSQAVKDTGARLAAVLFAGVDCGHAQGLFAVARSERGAVALAGAARAAAPPSLATPWPQQTGVLELLWRRRQRLRRPRPRRRVARAERRVVFVIEVTPAADQYNHEAARRRRAPRASTAGTAT